MCSAKTVTFGPVVAYPKPPAAGNIEQTKARFNCIGTLRDSLKMVGSNGSKLLTIRLVRSKLRKREESAAAATATAAAAATTNGNAGGAATINAAVAVNNNCINNNNNVDCQLPPAPSSPPPPHGQPAADVVQASAVPADVVDAPVPLPFLWQYSAKNAAAKNAATNGYNSSPYRLYTSDQDTLVCSVPIEETAAAEHRKGLRKNLRGKWRRLVHKKQQQQDAYKIPAELRDQLKQIYVY